MIFILGFIIIGGGVLCVIAVNEVRKQYIEYWKRIAGNLCDLTEKERCAFFASWIRHSQ